MNNYFLIAIGVMIFLLIFQIAKASEYVSILKGEEKSRKQTNRINGFFLVAFLILGLIGVWWCNHLYYGKTLFLHIDPNPAPKTDSTVTDAKPVAQVTH